MNLTEKYRPKVLNEISSQNHILKILYNLLEYDEITNNFLFYGLPGLGKTSCILSFAKHYYGENYHNMILELNASDDRGIDVVRNIIDNFVNTNSLFNKKNKMIILDEADSMTTDAQNLIVHLIEKHKNVIFCFICNYINKMNLAIKTRCLNFHFRKIKYEDMKKIIYNISQKENIKIEDEKILHDIYKLSNGDMRKCINIFENLIENNRIIDTNLYKIYNYPTNEIINNIINIIKKNDLIKSFEKIDDILKKNNIKLQNFINELTFYLTKNKIFPVNKLVNIYKKLGDIEYYLTSDYNYKIQLYSIISIFKMSFL
jgi:replication factor C subunit 3/5